MYVCDKNGVSDLERDEEKESETTAVALVVSVGRDDSVKLALRVAPVVSVAVSDAENVMLRVCERVMDNVGSELTDAVTSLVFDEDTLRIDVDDRLSVVDGVFVRLLVPVRETDLDSECSIEVDRDACKDRERLSSGEVDRVWLTEGVGLLV